VSSDSDVADTADRVRRGEVRAAELVRDALAAADEFDSELGIFDARFDESALAAAEEADAVAARGDAGGPLLGVPIVVKDNIATVEAACRAGSLVTGTGWGSGDAFVIARLRAAGAVVVGKTTMNEFAIGRPDPDKPFAVPRNPWNRGHWAGGSSSGSASAVAVGAARAAVGSDTGGSIRIPSAFCGVTGLKPTYGRVSNGGCVPAGASLDCIGPIARSARDCAVLLSVMAGLDPDEPTTRDVPVPDYRRGLTGDVTGIRVGVDRLDRVAGYAEHPDLVERLGRAVDVLAARGASVRPVELPLFGELTAATLLTAFSEGLAFHRDNLRVRAGDFAVDTRRTLLTGAFFTGADYVQAQRVRQFARRALAALLDEVDVVLTPTCSAPAPSVETMLADESTGGYGPIHTTYWNGAGNPAVTVPMGFADGLPLGLHIAGRWFDEQTVLRVADAYQRSTDWHLRRPSAPP
jgi:aspartyl-tRNA(Asn)/glutamyl-tRNA(Gln) amidotransferase subunit A